MLTRDSAGIAIKGSWFEVNEVTGYDEQNNPLDKNGNIVSGDAKKSYNIYKDPITDDGSKRSLKGFLQVYNKNPNCAPHHIKYDGHDEFVVKQECTPEEEKSGLLRTIYKNGTFSNQTTLTEIRERVAFTFKQP
jgi:hypothetical protein